MPKMKTRRGAAKRFKITGTGRIKRARAFRRHILTHKTRGRKRRLGQATLVASVDSGAIRRLIPYL
jgi:large subunit ribosomal protein L35